MITMLLHLYDTMSKILWLDNDFKMACNHLLASKIKKTNRYDASGLQCYKMNIYSY